MSVEREEKIGEDEYGSPIYDTVEIIANEPVRYDSGGTSYVRTTTGERVERVPTITGRGAVGEQVREGDTVTLTPLDPTATELSDLEVRGIDIAYHRRAHAGWVTLELEQH